MKKQKLYCYPRYYLLKKVAKTDIPIDPFSAIISISSTTDNCPTLSELGCLDSSRVLCLKFDDIGAVENCKNWSSPKAISMEQAEEIVNFIESHLDCNFYIHCDAGVSRSQAVVRFILDFYGEGREWEIIKDNPPEFPNMYVLWSLKKVWRKKHGCEYEDENDLS